MSIRIVAWSDTHGLHEQVELPDGDVLVHAGDLTAHGRLEEVTAFDAHLATLPHPHKVVIAGNHDGCFQRSGAEARRRLQNAIYLEDEGATVAGLRFWGSPWQPWFWDWAFNLSRGAALREKWALIPDDTDVLVTHGPPHGRLDVVHDGRREGCEELVQAVARVRPRVHIFGHIHEAGGEQVEDGIHFVNAAICSRSYDPVQTPVVIDLPC